MVSAKEKNGISLPEIFVDDDLSDSISPLAQVRYRQHKVPNTIKKMEKEKGSSHFVKRFGMLTHQLLSKIH